MMEELLNVSITEKICHLKKKWFFYSRVSILFILVLLLFQFNKHNIYKYIDFYCSIVLYILLALNCQIYVENLYLLQIEAILNIICFISISIETDKTFISFYSLGYHMYCFIFSLYFYTKFYIMHKKLEEEEEQYTDNEEECYA